MKFGVREITDVWFKARSEVKIGNQTFKKGQPIMHFDTCKTSSLESTVTTVYAQGGQGNPRLIGWDGEKVVTFTFEDALLSPLGFAILSGADVVKKASLDNRIHVHKTFLTQILDGGKVKIDYDMAGEDHEIFVSDTINIFGNVVDDSSADIAWCEALTDGIHLYNKEGEEVEPNVPNPDRPCEKVYEINNENTLEIDFGTSVAGKYIGCNMLVDCYVEKVSGATQIEIDASHFAGNYYIEASTLFREQSTGLDMPAEFVIPNAKIQSNFTFSMANSGDPSTFTFTCDAFPDYTKFDTTHRVMAMLQVIGEETVTPEEDKPVCPVPEIDPAFEYVVDDVVKVPVIAGYDKNTWSADSLKNPDAPDGDGRTIRFSSLGRNLSAEVDGTHVNFYGTINRVDNWLGFSSKPEDLTGFYYPFAMWTKSGNKLVKVTADGTTKTLVFGQTDDKTDGEYAQMTMIWAVHPDAPVQAVQLTDEAGTKVTDYSFDFSRCTFN